MVLCFDTTSAGIVYQVLSGLTMNVTGSFFISTLMLSFALIAIGLGCRIPIEITIIILMPLHLALLACVGGDFLAITGTMLIYLGILLGKNLFFR